MHRWTRLLGVGLATACLAATASTAGAHPGEFAADGIDPPVPSLPKFGPGASNMALLHLADKDGTINSDLAFHRNHAYAGNYDGFRIFDIRRPGRMRLLADVRCAANQGDVSVFEADNGRVYLLQSIDRAVTAPDCSGVATPTVQENERGATVTRARFGYEGLRLFDVTDASNPRYVRFYRTACGSHTHTLVPDPRNGQMHAYVASYPLGGQITPQVDVATSDAMELTCKTPHQAISIVSLPMTDPEGGEVRLVPLADESEPYDGDGAYQEEGQLPGGGTGPTGTGEPFISCHDHQAFLPRNIMVASCAGDLQYWDISDRGNPTTTEEGKYTLIQREVPEDDPATPDDERFAAFDFVHNATVTWDGELVAATDESGGGVEARCDAENTKRGFTYFYPLVEPGEEVDGFDDLLGTYIIPRAQNTEICVSHNGNVVPVADRYLHVQAFYQGGNSLYDFSNPSAPDEIAWSDLETSAGAADSWSSYWYNGYMYVNGGLARRGATGNRGFEAYRLRDEDGEVIRTERWRHSNPQTQERFQQPEEFRNGGGDDDEDEEDDDL